MVELHFPEFPFYMTIYKSVDVQTNTVKVIIKSDCHVKKEVTMPNKWTTAYVAEHPAQFREDIKKFVIKRYGFIRHPEKWS